MRADIRAELLQTKAGQSAGQILRKCVHCGFCLATCPTYQLLGDERDSPRGRIYLIKSLLENDIDATVVQAHLDRCLSCRACETTCPSGVDYAQLLDIGREQLPRQPQQRRLHSRLVRFLLRKWLTHRRLFASSVALARRVQWLLPTALKRQLGASRRRPIEPMPLSSGAPTVILLRGCVQASLTPNTNLFTQQLLAMRGIRAVELAEERCCGALSHHLAATAEARQLMRANIDAWWPVIEQGAEAIISTASGCGVMLKDYHRLLQDDAQYAEKARRISARVRDLSEYIAETISPTRNTGCDYQRVAFHNPCTLQHGQKINGVVESVLQGCGYDVLSPPESHLCCGSAGTYSLLQPALSKQLQERKINNLLSVEPDVIVTANIGCQLHLQQATDIPVKHWVELLQ